MCVCERERERESVRARIPVVAVGPRIVVLAEVRECVVQVCDGNRCHLCMRPEVTSVVKKKMKL